MQTIYARIDSDLAWFIVAVLVVLLLSAFAAVIGSKMTIADNNRKLKAQREAKYAEYRREWDAATEILAIPTYQREAWHPRDTEPYDLSIGVRLPEIDSFMIDDIRKRN